MSEDKNYVYILETKGIKETYRRLLIDGFSKIDAGNMIAEMIHLEKNDKGWTPKELEYLRFLKYLDDKENLEFK